MLRITIINERQKQQFSHNVGELSLGRIAHPELTSVVIDDIHVSREQLKFSQIDNESLRVESIGRSPVSLPDGSVMHTGEERDVMLPARLTVGQTLIEVEASDGSIEDEEDPQTMIAKRSESLKIITNEYIASFFPFPLAFGYRLLRGLTNPAELYKEQLRLAENVLAFIGTISLSLLEDEELAQMNAKFEGSAMNCWRGGISPGHWLDLSIHAADHLSRQLGESLPMELAGLRLKKGKGLGELMRNLIKAKNDHKHDRGPSTHDEYDSACEVVGEQLRLAYEALAFFKSFRILLVDDINPHRRGNKADVVLLKCMGDHPGFEPEHKVGSFLLRKGDVYIERSPDQLITLYPFIHAKTCPQCKTREFYFVDKMDEERDPSGSRVPVAVLKSFDRGHVVKDADVGAELAGLFSPAQ